MSAIVKAAVTATTGKNDNGDKNFFKMPKITVGTICAYQK